MPEIQKVQTLGPAMAGRIIDAPSLALITGTDGSAIQIPPGAALAVVENPADPNRIWTWILTEVWYNKLKFRCACGRPGCTRTATFKAIFKGVHPQKEGPEAR